MKFEKVLLGAAAAAVSSVMLCASPALALTVGHADSGNCYPFSCAPTDGVTEWQEAYRSGAFSGVTTFTTISFTKFTGVVLGPSMDTGSYTVSFFVAATGVGSLSSVLANNEGTFLGTFGTFNLSGPMPARLALSGSSITYDPSMGDLLMDVTVTGGSSFSGKYNQFFNADYKGIDVARAWNSAKGNFGNTTGALQTTFGAVPEPAAWALMLLGLGGIGAGLRSRRSGAPATA